MSSLSRGKLALIKSIIHIVLYRHIQLYQNPLDYLKNAISSGKIGCFSVPFKVDILLIHEFTIEDCKLRSLKLQTS